MSCAGAGCKGACTTSCYNCAGACSTGGCMPNCVGCSGCSGCGDGCSVCTSCTSCSGTCTSCRGCSGCSGCGNCGGACSNNCTSCSGCSGCSGCGNCGGACSNNCTSCSGCWGCSGTCSGTCSACTGNCSGKCDNGCTATAHADQYTKLGVNILVQKIIAASDMIDIQDFIQSEAARRSKTNVINKVTDGSRVSYSSMNEIYTELNSYLGYTGTKTVTSIGQAAMGPTSYKPYIEYAKTLYNQILVS